MNAAVDFAPALRLALMALAAASLPMAWLWLRQRGASAQRRLAALTALTLFLTFDLVVFGAFTRLTDSGLGCPDWPGCYGHASPLGADQAITAAESAVPGGPVTWSKAWIEMIHRYLAMTVGALIVAIAAFSWFERRRLPFAPWLPGLTLVWVIVQGLFGKYTVTLKLYPAVVSLHLLGGLTLLALLAVQHAAFSRRTLALGAGLRATAVLALVALVMQVGLGAWVSSNYAVLACKGFPLCNGSWWPDADFSRGFTLLRGLGGLDALGRPFTLASLVAIHLAHRTFAIVASTVLIVLAWRLLHQALPEARSFGLVLVTLLLAQWASGLSNVILGWPLFAALAHSAGAAALVVLLALLLTRSGLPQRAGKPVAAAVA